MLGAKYALLSEHFVLSEFTKSELAIRKGLDNTPPAEAVANLRHLCQALLEPLRASLGHPIVINSGYRSKALNKAVGGVSTSQHLTGEAADIECMALSNAALADRIEALAQAGVLTYDQLGREFHHAKDPRAGWVHVSVSRTKNRRETFTVSG